MLALLLRSARMVAKRLVGFGQLQCEQFQFERF